MTVFLVGAGPGDPGLLTRRGAEVLARADLVVFDRLIDRALLALVPEGAECVDAGKRPSRGGAAGGMSQDEITELLVTEGRRGRTVVRLKGGDPFVLGRGGEEAAALRDAGVAFEVVPGVSSALAVPAAAGIPVTYRGLASSVTILTGHGGADGDPDAIDWSALGPGSGTLVVLMGVGNRAEIARRLRQAGRPGDTPVALIERGTTAAQRVVRTSLDELGSMDLEAPATIVVGPVAALDVGPSASGVLSGRTVVVTRAATQAAPLVEALSAAGARVVALPLIEIGGPSDDGASLRSAASSAGGYRWIMFTSANAVEAFVTHLRDGRDLAGVRLGAVGPETAAALARAGLVADLVPTEHRAEALAAALPAAAPGDRVLFPRAEGAGATLVDGLVARGYEVDQVDAYRTRRAARPPGERWDELAGADAVTFTSPSTLAAYFDLRRDGHPLPAPALAVCIGPVTAAAARRAGIARVVEAADASPAGLVAALADALGAPDPPETPSGAR